MKKQWFLIVAVVLFSLGAQTVSATEMNTGLMQPEIVDVPNAEADEMFDRETTTQSAQSEGSEWGKYANYYYYNQLDPDLKAAWDALDEVCEAYYSADKDVTNFYKNILEKKCGRTEYVSLSKPMKAEPLRIFLDMYRASNPQYYFLANSYVRTYSSVQTEDETEYNGIALGVYDAFWDGEARANATAQVKQQLAAWQSEIDMCTSDEAKLQKIQDLICTKVTYDDDAAAGKVDEQISFSQSPYSVICRDSTVCAGYADTFYMLCNASEIDAISVTSSNHQWNKVRVNGSWYNFDVTWDDNNTESFGTAVYLYHGRSDAMYDTDMGSGFTSNIESHQEETFWEAYLPLCALDTNPVYPYTTPGTFPISAKQVATPQIDVLYVNGVPQVTLLCDTENAVLYYTTDGTTPSVADRNTHKYEGAFRAGGDMQIKVLAVCDTYADSEIAVKFIEWEEYKITYILDGGENHAANPDSYTVRDTVTLQSPSKTGYIFDGWYVDDGYKQIATKIAAGSTGTYTFYAKWIPITYSISFDENGATSGDTSPLAACNYDTTYALTANKYVKAGYTFTGWNSKADGSGVTYADEAKVKNLTETNNANITLYAQWIPIVYKISFDGNGAEDGTMSLMDACEYDELYTLATNEYKKTGCVFVGWNTKEDGSGVTYADEAMVKNLTTENGVSVTLYAQWAADNYKISFSGNGATGGTMSLMSGLYQGEKYVLTKNDFVRTGYVFKGWNSNADGSGESYSDQADVYNMDTKNTDTVILYAQWKAIVYKVVFNGNGATGGATAPLAACEYDSSYVLTANSFARTGHTFTGWNTKADGSGTAYTNKASVKNLTTTEGAVITLYAQWKTNSYTIKFDGNKAGKGSMKSMSSLLYGKSYGLASNKYKRTGYRFDGWNTAKNGKGIAVKNKATIQNLSTKDGGVVVLYAQWKANKYSVKFHGNGATSGSMKKMKSRTYNKKFKLSANKFKREGYKFIGWNTKKNGKGKMYKNKAKVKNLTSKNGKTVTLYAQWKKL